MVKCVRFKFKGVKYTLEFSVDSIQQMERMGFYADDVLKKRFTLLPDLFAGAFIVNHPTVSDKLIGEIYSKFDNKLELFEHLVCMYSAAATEYTNNLTKVKNGIPWEKA